MKEFTCKPASLSLPPSPLSLSSSLTHQEQPQVAPQPGHLGPQVHDVDVEETAPDEKDERDEGEDRLEGGVPREAISTSPSENDLQELNGVDIARASLSEVKHTRKTHRCPIQFTPCSRGFDLENNSKQMQA